MQATTDDDLLPETVPRVTLNENLMAAHVPTNISLSSEQIDNTMGFQTLDINVQNTSMSRSHSKHSDRLLHHCLPVTCLKLLDGIVLVASEGPSLLIKMAYFNEQRLQKFQIFPSQLVISGMEFLPNPVLECGDNLNDWHKKPDKLYDHVYIGYVWAGSMGTLIRLTRSMKSGLNILECVGDDYCNSFFNFDFIPVAAKWLNGGNILALLSVLNYVVIFERKERQGLSGTFTDLKEIARIKCSKSETLFSGTIAGNVRNNVRIFSGTVFNGIIVWDIDAEGQAVIKHELKCHDGIVFSLEYYANRKLLLSTSDDRTVAVWQFNRENDEKEDVKLVHRFYGHDARVWKALSVHGYILSVGESSDVRVNILKDGKEHKKWEAHDGAPIFTCVYDEDVEILYTGGNDGTIRRWAKWWYQVKPRVLPFDVISIHSKTAKMDGIDSSGRWTGNKDFPKTVALLDINHVIVSMESGRVTSLDWEGKLYDLLHDPRCEGYQIIKMSPDQQILAVAGNDGHFYTAQLSFSENQSSGRNILYAKKLFMTRVAYHIISMIWLNASRLLVICFNRAILLLMEENTNRERSEVQFIQTFDLKLSRPGVPAAVEILGKYIVFGDEIGTLHLLRYHKTNEEIQSLENVHKDGVTSLVYHDSKFYSSGRDGKVKVFELKIDPLDDLEVEFIPLTSFSMPFEWTCGIYVNMLQLLCCGFQKEDFVVYSINQKRTLAKIPCGGGGNRKWDFKYGHGKDGSQNASFAFVRDKEICYSFLPMEGYLNVSIKDGLHSKVINCAIQVRSEGNIIDYISGSEDGSLKWFQWDTKNQNILSVDSMENHVSSVRSAWKITTMSNQTFLFAGGGRSQLCIYKLDFNNRRIEPLKEIILVKTSFKQTEGDVRIMDIVVTERDQDELCCFNACSDGIVRVVHFNTKTNKFKISGLLNGNAHAVMRIELLKSATISDGVHIFGVTSNGYCLLWTWKWDDANLSVNLNKNAVPEKKSNFQMLLRKTAFLSMRVILSSLENDDENYSVICGGDDCSISSWTLTITKESNNSKYLIKENWTWDQSQRGAVVGVETDNKYVYTLSNDQIIGVWSSTDGKLYRKVYAGVSDCQGFVVDTPNGCIMCYGKGVSWVPINSSIV